MRYQMRLCFDEIFVDAPVWLVGDPLPVTLELCSEFCIRVIKPLDGEERDCESWGRDKAKGGGLAKRSSVKSVFVSSLSQLPKSELEGHRQRAGMREVGPRRISHISAATRKK